jgi:hypothetical protein
MAPKRYKKKGGGGGLGEGIIIIILKRHNYMTNMLNAVGSEAFNILLYIE